MTLVNPTWSKYFGRQWNSHYRLKELHIKQETTYHAQNYLYDEVVGPKEEEIFIEEDKTTQKESYQTLYTQKENPHHSNITTRQLAVNNNPNCNPSNRKRVSQNWRSTSKRSTNPHGRNSLLLLPERYWMPTKCAVCQNINHWAQNCRGRCTHDNNTYILNEVSADSVE